MERLTELVGDNWIARQKRMNGKYPTDRDVYHKLAKYEDLEEQGLLIKLPCKVGELVYSVNTINSSIYEHEIKNFMITDTGEYVYAESVKSGHQFKLSDFGETVFLTKEEAEKTLGKID